MNLALQDIRRTPCRDMTPAQHFVLEVHGYLTEIRHQANRLRANPWLQEFGGAAHMDYLVGRLHGYVFGMSSLLIHRGGYFEVDDIGAAAMAEAEFLSHAYIAPEHQQ